MMMKAFCKAGYFSRKGNVKMTKFIAIPCYRICSY